MGSGFIKDIHVINEYVTFARKFKTNRALATTFAECGSFELVIALYKKEQAAF